jgi:hypothetical protein
VNAGGCPANPHPPAPERIVGTWGDLSGKLGLLLADRAWDGPDRIDALVPDLELAGRRGILGVAHRGREYLGPVVEREIEEPHLRDVDHESLLLDHGKNDG